MPLPSQPFTGVGSTFSIRLPLTLAIIDGMVVAVGEERYVDINRYEMTEIIEARIEEIFSIMLKEIKRSGYDGLLPAGMVITGGSSELKGISEIASNVLGMPVRKGHPENLTGMVDKLQSPAFSTSVGLTQWAVLMSEINPNGDGKTPKGSESPLDWKRLKDLVGRFLP